MAFDEGFNQECLRAHNGLRALHDAAPLSLSPRLAQDAQRWADHLVETGRLQHSPHSGREVGESLAIKWTSGRSDFRGDQVTDQWYSEISQYRFGEENQFSCGNFSQLVWRATREAGFGKALAPSGKIFIVGRYSPAGNIMNEWDANVRPPRETDSDSTRQETEDESVGDVVVDMQFNQECLDSHNFYRKRHGAPPLEFDADLARRAQNWAETLAQLGALQHSPASEGKVGENVGMKWSTRRGDITGQKATDQWYNESKHYNYEKENQLNCGHFSQVVWRSTKRAGFGKAFGRDGKVFVVGQYTPPGNYRNRWCENVRRPHEQNYDRGRSPLPEESGRSTPGSSRSSRSFDFTEFDAEELATFNEECLTAHNKVRRLHGAQDLKINARLMESAQRWAEKMAESGSLSHSTESGAKVGENVGMKWSTRGSNITGEQATDQWYKESKMYNYGKENQLNCGHFSQVVWRSTKEAGFGKARTLNGKIFVVAHYHPPGNYRDRWRDNVLPPVQESDLLRLSRSPPPVTDVPDRLSSPLERGPLERRSPQPRDRSPLLADASPGGADPVWPRGSLSSTSSSPRASPAPASPSPAASTNGPGPREEEVTIVRSRAVHAPPPARVPSPPRLSTVRETPRESLMEERREEEEEWERPPEFQRRGKTAQRSVEPSSRQQDSGSDKMSSSRYGMNGDTPKEAPITKRKAATIERSPSPTDPDDKYFRGPKNPSDQMLSRKLMRRNKNSVIHLTTAEVYERPNGTRYVVIGAATEAVTGRVTY